MAYDPEQITFFAKTDARGQNVPFGIKAKDRTRHVYVIGKTGMGKSTLLENMAVQDMQNGNGLAFIDPHGATAETLLEYVPEERKDDVLYFAPFDTEHPIAFNVMEDVGPEKRHLVAAGLMSVFKKIWVDAWSARMEYILQNTLLALLEYPESTLLGVNRMLSEKHYRQKVIDNISDPAVKSFWVDEFLNYNERYMQEAGDSIKNKIGQFTANPLIRNIIGQPRTSFDLRQIMDEQKIVIVNLSKGLIGEGNANLLGSMLTTRIYLAAMSRADLPPAQMKQMPNFYFYVDEFQSFANATFADILSEARKYHLNLTIAHQYVEQMEEEVRNAVFGNVGTIISFRVGPFDAETLETIFAPQFYAVDICNLGFAQIYLSLMIDGIGSRPFSATTLPPIEQPHVSCRDMVIACSQERFGSERSVVEKQVNDWMAEDHAPPKPPRKGPSSGNGNNGGGYKNSGAGKPASKKATHKKDTGLADTLKQVQQAPAAEKAKSDPPAAAVVSPAEILRQHQVSPTESSSEHLIEKTEDATVNPPVSTPEPVKANKVAATSKTTPPQPVEKAKVTTDPPAASAELEALRSVLKDLSQASKKDKTKEPPKVGESPRKKPVSKQDAKQGAVDLRTALADVLAERETKTKRKKKDEDAVSQTQAAQQLAKQHSKEVISPASPAVSSKKTQPVQQPSDDKQPDSTAVKSSTVSTQSARTPEMVNAYQAAKSRDPLDPKKIERMLRVTGADNSPFKKR